MSDNFGAELRKILNDNNIKQAEFANAIGLSNNAVNEWVTGRRVPKWVESIKPVFEYLYKNVKGFNPLQLVVGENMTYNKSAYEIELDKLRSEYEQKFDELQKAYNEKLGKIENGYNEKYNKLPQVKEQEKEFSKREYKKQVQEKYNNLLKIYDEQGYKLFKNFDLTVDNDIGKIFKDYLYKSNRAGLANIYTKEQLQNFMKRPQFFKAVTDALMLKPKFQKDKLGEQELTELGRQLIIAFCPKQ